MSETHRVTLDIRQKNGHFEALLSSDTQLSAQRLRLDLTNEDLRQLNEELTQNLAKVVLKIGNKLHMRGKARDLIREEFRWLAELGCAALKDIFYPEDLSALREMIGTAPRVILHIVSSDFVFPWELLYDDYRRDYFQYENFWGFKYVIYRNIPPHSGQDVPRPEIEMSPVSVGLLADRALPKVARVEIPFLRKLEKAKFIRLLSPVERLDSTKRDDLVATELKRFFSQDIHIIHFACHTRQPVPEIREPFEEYCLLLSKDFPLWPKDFKVSTLAFGDYPLVVLNSCGTSPRDPRKTRNFVRVLFRYGARGVVTTECIVPDTLAAAFTQQFYPLLLSGRDVGDALFETRISLLKAPYNNPLGLLYALYAFPHTQFILTD